MKNNRSYRAQRKLHQQRGEGSCSFTKLSAREERRLHRAEIWTITPEIGNWTSSWLAALTNPPEGLWRGRAWASCSLTWGRIEGRPQGSALSQTHLGGPHLKGSPRF